MKKRIKNDEIDLVEVFINIWDNKLKIATITAIFISLSVAIYFIIKPQLNAKTEILPITIFENNLYSAYNSLLSIQSGSNDEKTQSLQGLKKINKDNLLNLFIEEIKTKEVVIDAIKKYQLIDQSKFNDEGEYLEKVEKYALKLDLIKPINVDDNEKGETRLNWIIEFKINDQKKWEEALSFIEFEINKKIQNYLILNFNSTVRVLKLLNQFKLEDINQKIEFSKNDYVVETSNRLAFLNEQLAIARKLNLKNNTLEVENFNTSSGGIISNLQTAKPYYMRGYSMIEKEIELIESRTNKDAFTKNLLDLEKQRRDILENKKLKRITTLFNETPVISDNDFKAAKIVYKNTEFKNSFDLINAISIAGVFGILFGIFYTMILSAIKIRNKN